MLIGRWHCSHCAVCRSCGSRTPSGLPGAPPAPISGPPDQWHHHLKKGASGQKVYSHTLCGPCARYVLFLKFVINIINKADYDNNAYVITEHGVRVVIVRYVNVVSWAKRVL